MKKNNVIVLPSGEEFQYKSYEDDIIQRVQGNGKIKYMTIYYGDSEDLVVYVHSRKETWYYKKAKYKVYMPIKKQIEKRKQKLRLKNKYKNYKLTDRFSYKKMLRIYRDLTDACDEVIEHAQEVFKKLGYNMKTDTISIQETIEASKEFNWKWNFLFTEWFEEEAE